MRKTLLIGAALLAGYSPAFAAFGTCTGHVDVGITSTQVVAENDVPGGRHLLSLQNTGTNPMYCAIGEVAATATNGMLIQPAGALYLESVQGVNGVFFLIPIGAVDCIAVGGTTTAVFCDY